MRLLRWPGVVNEWGSTVGERAAPYGCDNLIERREGVVFRAVDVAAPSDLVFRWLCQLRVAPYSYDWIDNLGRRSPSELTPGLDELEIGQTFATIFRLVAFEPGRSLTLNSKTRVFGRVALTYAVTPHAPDRSRIVVKLVFGRPPAPHGIALRALLPAGDLVMMRKELRTFKKYAERDARRAVRSPA